MNEENIKDIILQEELLASWENYQQNIQVSVPSVVNYDSIPGLNQTDLNKESGLKKEKHTIAVGNNKSNYESPQDYPAKHIGTDPDLFADSDYIENDKIQRKIIGRWKPDKVSKSIEDLHTTINQKEQPMKAYIGDSPLNPIDRTGKVESIEDKNSENFAYIKTTKEIDPSKLISIQAISAYLEQAYPIKIDPVAEFEHKSTNRRYSVS